MELIPSSDFQKYVFHTLECPVCLEIATPPVTLCKRGHFICGICRKKLDRCVICRDEYTNTRCYTVENIASKISVKCRNKPCEMTQTIANLADHMEKCDYRPLICNGFGKTVCKNESIDFDKFLDHLREAHEVILENGLYQVFFPDWVMKMINDKKGTITWKKRLYAHDDVTFILNIVKKDAVQYIWVAAMLPESKASNYIADVHIGQEDVLEAGKINGDTGNLKWKVGVVSVHATLKDMEESKDCVAFPATRMISVSGTNPNEVDGEGDGEDEGESFSIHVELKSRKL